MSFRSEEGLCCPVCTDVFKDPVVLACSHSFCKDCLQTWWRQNPTRQCPICKKKSSKADPPCNLVLKNLCEDFLLQRDQSSSEDLCSLHAEKFKLFCLDHQEPVCVVCRDSEKHAGHRFKPIDEAAQQHKKSLQDTLKPFKEKLMDFERIRGKFDKTLQHIKVQARLTEAQIKGQFKKLHQFLQEEEEARLRALREEEEQKSRRMKEQMEALSREIEALSQTLRDTEEHLMAKDVLFLKHYKAAVKRVQQRPLLEDPQLPSGALIDQAKHLGNLAFNIWTKMKDLVSYTPIVLDPNTAHPEFFLSEDLTSITDGPMQQLPDNPERFRDTWAVLGSEGFESGTHVWDIEVGQNDFWRVGVSFQRRENMDSDFWGIEYKSWLKYTACSPTYYYPFELLYELQKIRVKLDCDRGRLSFSDPDSDKVIHTFVQKFTERVFPYVSFLNCVVLYVGGDSDEIRPLKVSPMKVCVTQEHV